MCCTVYAETCILCTNPLTPRTTEGDMDANTVAINFVWTLVAGFLVMFMQAGFALVETGFTRAKNAAHTMTMNFMVYGIAMLAYWAVGFALQAGGVGPLGTLGGYDQLSHEVSVTIGGKTWGLFGGTGFFLTGVAYTAPVFAYFLFQMVFMDTAATIPTGALAERWRFVAFAVFSVFVGAFIYPIYANWTWGGGWLAMLGKNLGLGHGHVDFAGSSVVHMTGGVMAFVAAALLGPRRGKYNADGSVNAIPGHNIPMALIGTFILAFGWFAMEETGFTRAKNAAHTITMNFMVYGIAMLAYWAIGFALQAGGVGALGTLGGYDKLAHEFSLTIAGKQWGLFGGTGFFLTGVAYTAPVFAYFLFQMVFMDTAATIPTGAMAERWKFLAFVVFSVFVGAFIYPIYANWTWGGGWLSMLGKNLGLGHGHVDFAGSSVVHMTGGVMALVGASLLGPRRGKYNFDGSANAIPGHNIPMALVGTFILAFGWFGFNAGSTLAGSDLRIGVIATNTMLAGAAGSITAMLYMWLKYDKPDPSMMANRALAGLVAITAPCAFVTAPSAVVIGGLPGVFGCSALFFLA